MLRRCRPPRLGTEPVPHQLLSHRLRHGIAVRVQHRQCAHDRLRQRTGHLSREQRSGAGRLGARRHYSAGEIRIVAKKGTDPESACKVSQ